MKKSILAGAFVSLALGTIINAQVSTPNNGAPGNATHYVGWNATRMFPLTVSHKGNFPINFETNATERLRITPTGLVGLNNPTPTFHLDILTPEVFGGELLFRTRVGIEPAIL